MRYSVIISKSAEAEIAASFRWIAAISSTSALRWLGRLRKHISRLKADPKRWPEAPEASWYGASIRQMLIGKKPHVYRGLFEIEGHAVYILRVRHGRQNILSPEDL